MCAGKSLFKTSLVSCWQLLTCLLLLLLRCLSAFCTNRLGAVPSFLRSARPHGTMILRSVLPVIFRKRPCLVTLLLGLSCCLHSPRHSKPVYMESQFHSRQNPAWFLRVRLVGGRKWAVCLLFSVRLRINIHPTSENQPFGIHQTLSL